MWSKLGRIRLEITERPGSLKLVDFAERMVTPGWTRRLRKKGYTHEYVKGYTAADPTEILHDVHLVASLLKRWLTGTMHFAVADYQPPYYLNEFTFRFNHRGLLFYPRRSTSRNHRNSISILDNSGDCC